MSLSNIDEAKQAVQQRCDELVAQSSVDLAYRLQTEQVGDSPEYVLVRFAEHFIDDGTHYTTPVTEWVVVPGVTTHEDIEVEGEMCLEEATRHREIERFK
jgi:hypothetical protein